MNSDVHRQRADRAVLAVVTLGIGLLIGTALGHDADPVPVPSQAPSGVLPTDIYEDDAP